MVQAWEQRSWQSSLVAYRLLGEQGPLTLSLPEQIATRIGDRILDDGYAPGQRIIEQDLADAFAVSRGPIREALRLLESEGLVRIHPRRGAQVTLLTEEEVREVFEVRSALMRIVSERLAKSRSPAAIKLLEEGLGELARHAADPAGGRAYADTTFRLGLAAVRLVGNRTLADIVTSLALRSLRYTRLGLAAPERRCQSIELWREALAAIRTGNTRRAGELAVQRVQASRDEALRQIRASAQARADAA